MASPAEIESVVSVLADAIPCYVGCSSVALFILDCQKCRPAGLPLLDFADHCGSWLIGNYPLAESDWPAAVRLYCDTARFPFLV